MKRIVAVNSNSYHKYSIQQAIDGIRKAGFHNIELTATKGWTEHVFPTMSFAALCDVKDLLKEAGLVPVAMSGHCNLMDEERIGDFIANIRLAAFMGSKYIVSSIGEAHIEENAVASDEVVAEHVRGLVPYLQEHGLTLVLENHGEHGTGKRLKSIIDLIGAPCVKINYDTANAIFYGGVNLEEDIGACIDDIAFMHFKDKAGAQTEWNFPALGEGYINFPMILQKLEQAGNYCPVSIEIEFTQEGSENVQQVDAAVQQSREYLAGIGLEV